MRLLTRKVSSEKILVSSAARTSLDVIQECGRLIDGVETSTWEIEIWTGHVMKVIRQSGRRVFRR